jgi:hypothetical protein
MKLYLKGERCFTEKCSVTRRPYPPGQHGQGRIKLSEYGLRLREKQKMRRVYGLLEMQFARYYEQATGLKGRTGEEMLGLIERRLDNVVHRISELSSLAQRQDRDSREEQEDRVHPGSARQRGYAALADLGGGGQGEAFRCLQVDAGTRRAERTHGS